MPADPPAADLAAADLTGLAIDLRAAGDLRPAPSTELSFGPAATFPAPLFAYHFAVGRLDGDDLDDLVVSGRPSASVYLSRGDGALTPKPLGLLADWQVAIADLNRDGKGDLLLSDTSNNAVTIAIGNGDGSVRTPPLTAAAGATPHGVTAADVNGDGIPDALAVDQASAELRVLIGKGDGSLTAGQRLPTGRAPLWVTSGDLDRDGDLDAVAVNLGGSFTVYLGKGDGTFAEGREVKTIAGSTVLVLGDLDLDGDLDAAVNGEGADQAVAVHLGDGTGGFAAPTLLKLSAPSGQGLTIADLNRDGLPDLVAACAFSSPARVFLGAGGGAFLPERLFPGGTKNVFNVAAVDLNRDGLPDLVLSEGNDQKISVLLNTTPR